MREREPREGQSGRRTREEGSQSSHTFMVAIAVKRPRQKWAEIPSSPRIRSPRRKSEQPWPCPPHRVRRVLMWLGRVDFLFCSLTENRVVHPVAIASRGSRGVGRFRLDFRTTASPSEPSRSRSPISLPPPSLPPHPSALRLPPVPPTPFPPTLPRGPEDVPLLTSPPDSPPEVC